LLSLAGDSVHARIYARRKIGVASLLVLITLKTYGGETEGGSSQIKH